MKFKSHMFHANIEAGIEHVCKISNRNFQKFPLAFSAGQFVDNTFLLQAILLVQCRDN